MSHHLDVETAPLLPPVQWLKCTFSFLDVSKQSRVRAPITHSPGMDKNPCLYTLQQYLLLLVLSLIFASLLKMKLHFFGLNYFFLSLTNLSIFSHMFTDNSSFYSVNASSYLLTILPSGYLIDLTTTTSASSFRKPQMQSCRPVLQQGQLNVTMKTARLD